MNKHQFLIYVKGFCQKHDIEFKIFQGTVAKTLMKNTECSGFFEHNSNIKPTLGIAMDLPDNTFHEILVHEFSHANQYLEKSPVWVDSRLTSEEIARYSTPELDLTGLETGDLFELWLERKIELPMETIENLVKRTTDMEFDCEKRVIQLVRELSLPIDVELYSQKANAYLSTYFYALKNRRWTTSGRATYLVNAVYTAFPKTLDPSFCKQLPLKIENLINQYCIISEESINEKGIKYDQY